MKSASLLKSWVVVVLAILIASTPIIAQNASSDYLQGKMDGEAAAKGDPMYTVLGFGCGCIGYLIAMSSSPSPPPEMIMGKSNEYVQGFTEGYKEASRKKNMSNACSGWIVGATFSILINTLLLL